MKLLSFKLMLTVSAVALIACEKKTDNDPDEGNKIDLAGLEETTYAYDDAVIRNPERGWYTFNAFDFPGNHTPLVAEDIKRDHVDRGISIIHNIYHMYDYTDKPLSQEILDVFDSNMNAIREAGAKCLLRFSYSASFNTGANKPIENSDAPFDIFSGHIAQLKPLIQKHSDVLFVMEAGFIGAWGEWYYTDNYGFQPEKTPEDYVPRRQLLDKLLDAVPTHRMICVRYPAAKMMMFDLLPADSVTVTTAFNESDLSRVAMHNDCFVSTANDTGTFFGETERDFWNKESRYLIMGGETCNLTKYSVCDNTITRMEDNHFTYLNEDYNGRVIAGWKTGNCYDEIDQRLGYRLSLTSAYFTEEPSVDKPLDVALFINSNGFAGPMNPRDMEIVFVEKGGSGSPIRIKTDIDPRFWFAGQTHGMKLSLDISKLSAGKTYNVYLNLPDPETALNTRPEYSIRLANKNMWDEATGYNFLREITL